MARNGRGGAGIEKDVEANTLIFVNGGGEANLAFCVASFGFSHFD